jgi:UDP-hydrolysing UDP-N-acetyl-D-glucosamine 2-epimerase
MNKIRKICVVVASRANYGRVKYLLKAIKKHPCLELQLIVGASMLLERFGKASDVIEKDGFIPDKEIYYIVEGENLQTQAKSTGLGIIELTTAFTEMKPDIVVTVADRFETMATAIAASYLNIPLAHVQGGEITGNIDESVRHAITKLAHYHFPSTEQSRERILKMGEEPWRVLNTGCPSVDLLCNIDLAIHSEKLDKYNGVGHKIKFDQPYILVMQHPVTSSFNDGYEQIMETLYALKERPEQKLVMWPNIDAGSDRVSKGIRTFREKYQDRLFGYYKNFSPEDYAVILNNAICVVGNSSSFVREGSFLGIPAVMVGNRQEGREHGENVTYANYDRMDIGKSIEKQIAHGRYPSVHIFGDGTAGEKMAEYMANVKLSINKRMTY